MTGNPNEQVSHVPEQLCAADGCLLVLLIHGQELPARTQFPTPNDLSLQVGYIVYSAGGEVPRHFHHPVERRIVGTSEVILVQRGCCELSVYDDHQQLVTTRKLVAGDIAIMVAGGHGFRMLEDTVLLEVKQGPYTGLVEKQRF